MKTKNQGCFGAQAIRKTFQIAFVATMLISINGNTQDSRIEIHRHEYHSTVTSNSAPGGAGTPLISRGIYPLQPVVIVSPPPSVGNQGGVTIAQRQVNGTVIQVTVPLGGSPSDISPSPSPPPPLVQPDAPTSATKRSNDETHSLAKPPPPAETASTKSAHMQDNFQNIALAILCLALLIGAFLARLRRSSDHLPQTPPANPELRAAEQAAIDEISSGNMENALWIAAQGKGRGSQVDAKEAYVKQRSAQLVAAAKDRKWKELAQNSETLIANGNKQQPQ